MKRHGQLYPEVCSFENLLRAVRKALRGKRKKRPAALFELSREQKLVELRRALIEETWQPGPYKSFWVLSPKKRLITAAPFEDRVVHHALMNVVEPLVDPSFIHDSYACRKDKGTHRALWRALAYCRRYPWALRTDIVKYFPSIDHAILKDTLRRKLKDAAVLDLLFRIIDSSPPECAGPCLYFPGDDLLTPTERRRGLPIGNLTSQFLANLYLDPLDHAAKEVFGAAGYIRYCDDIVLFDKSPGRLYSLIENIRKFLYNIRLRLHKGKTILGPTKAGFAFLGFFVDIHGIRAPSRVRNRTGKALKELTRKFKHRQCGFKELRQTVAGLGGHLLGAGCEPWFRARLRHVVF